MVANVLIGFNKVGIPDKKLERVVKYYEQEFRLTDKLQVGKVDFVYDATSLYTSLLSGQYDILVVTEQMSKNGGTEIEHFGKGSMKAWKRDYCENINIVMLVDASKRGERKLADFYINKIYNACFPDEISRNTDKFFDVVVNGRTQAEAFEYYGLTDELLSTMVDDVSLVKPAEPVEEREEAEVFEEIPQSVNSEKIVYPDIDLRLTNSKERTVEYVENEKVEVYEEPYVKEPRETVRQSRDIPPAPPVYEEPTFRQEEYHPEYPQLYINLDTLGASTEVRIDGVIKEIITDDVMIISCPKGGLTRNKEALKDMRIEIVLKDI